MYLLKTSFLRGDGDAFSHMLRSPSSRSFGHSVVQWRHFGLLISSSQRCHQSKLWKRLQVDVKAKASKRTAPRPYGSVVAVMAKWCCDASEQKWSSLLNQIDELYDIWYDYICIYDVSVKLIIHFIKALAVGGPAVNQLPQLIVFHSPSNA